MDIILCGTPKSWHREMDRQGCDPLTHSTSDDVIVFMENLEHAEELRRKVNFAHEIQGQVQWKGKVPFQWQHFEGFEVMSYPRTWRSFQPSDECHKLQAAAKKLKSGDSSGGNYSNKTWTKKAHDSNKSSQNELNALIKKTKKELNSLTKKKTKELNMVAKKCKQSVGRRRA